jgi:hypothetical protein
MQISKSKHYYMHYLGTNRNTKGESSSNVIWSSTTKSASNIDSHNVHTKENIHQINKHTPLHE